MRRVIGGLALAWSLIGTAVLPVLADCTGCGPDPVDAGPGAVAATVAVLVTALALLFVARPRHDEHP